MLEYILRMLLNVTVLDENTLISGTQTIISPPVIYARSYKYLENRAAEKVNNFRGKRAESWNDSNTKILSYNFILSS